MNKKLTYNSVLTGMLLLIILLTGIAGPRNAVADLLGVTLDYPLVTAVGGPGNATYNAGTGLLSVQAQPQLILSARGASPVAIGTPRSFSIQIMLNAATGQVVGGNPGSGNDLQITGVIPSSPNVPGSPYSGVLLTGKILDFGFLNQTGSTDRFDFRFAVTGGALATGPLAAQYQGKDLGLTLVVEQSTFTGLFNASFSGLPKVSGAGPTPTLCIDLKKQISVDGGQTFVDADDAAGAPKRSASVEDPVNAHYRLLVTNCSATGALENVVIEDATIFGQGVTVPLPGGGLAPGQSVTVTQADSGFAALNQSPRCTEPGDYSNVAMVTGESTSSSEKVTDSDSALLICTPPPCIDLTKEVSVNGGEFSHAGTTHTDADNVQYRLTVENCSQTVALQNVAIEDVELFGATSLALPNGGTLGAGQTVILTGATAGFGALAQPDRCGVTPGDYPNTAQVSGESVVDGKPVEAIDSALVTCAAPPQADCNVLVDVAANPDSLIKTPDGSCQNVTFTYTVTNLGDTANVSLSDSFGPVADSLVLNRGDEVTAPVIPSKTVCVFATTINTVLAQAAVTNNSCAAVDSVTVSVVGQPSIQLEKQISVAGGTFVDADQETDPDVPSVTAPSGARYKLIVTNNGTADLVNVIATDPTLGVSYTVPGTLAAGQSHEVILTEAEYPALQQRCGNPGAFVNEASVSGQSAENPADTVSASDQAWLICNAPPQAVCNVSVGITANPQSVTLSQGTSCANVTFTYTVTNNGDAAGGSLTDLLGLLNISDLSLAPGTTESYSVTQCISADATNAVLFNGTMDADGEVCGAASDTVTVPVTTTGGGGTQGCTPGYWKQNQHFGSWVGYGQSNSFATVFGLTAADMTEAGLSVNLTLLQALKLGGGEAKALARHSVAALLNTANTGVDYYYTVAQVIAGVQQAFTGNTYEPTKNQFAAQNEKGCPLGRDPGDG